LVFLDETYKQSPTSLPTLTLSTVRLYSLAIEASGIMNRENAAEMQPRLPIENKFLMEIPILKLLLVGFRNLNLFSG
jgi:hypothetical protein